MFYPSAAILAQAPAIPTYGAWLRLVDVAFGGDEPDAQIGLLQIAARAALIYVVGVVVVRIGKGRMIGRATALDVILGFVLGSLLSRAITGHASLSETILASLTLVTVHWLLTYLAVEWHWFGNAFKGHAYKIVANGKMLPDQMRQSHISEHDLISAIRLQGISNLNEVADAWKERSGDISVIRRREPKVVEISVQAGVQTVWVEIA